MKDPSTMATTPPAVRTPWLTILISAIRRATPNRMSSTPAQLMGRLWKAKKARIREMPPMTPGSTTPGSHRRHLPDPGLLRLPEPAHQLGGRAAHPVRGGPPDRRDQDREPWGTHRGWGRGHGARILHALRRTGGRLSRLVDGDPPHRGRNGRPGRVGG